VQLTAKPPPLAALVEAAAEAQRSARQPLPGYLPRHLIARGCVGAGLLAHIVVSEYDHHVSLYRQAEIYAREGVDLEPRLLLGWLAATTAALAPLSEVLAADVIVPFNRGSASRVVDRAALAADADR
jgi:transposase